MREHRLQFMLGHSGSTHPNITEAGPKAMNPSVTTLALTYYYLMGIDQPVQVPCLNYLREEGICPVGRLYRTRLRAIFGPVFA
jgi:hypothetical protein